MLKPKEELLSALKNKLNEVRYDKKVLWGINEYLSQYNETGTINEIVVDLEKLNDINPDLLCLITIALFEETKDPSIDPRIFYHEREINIAKRYTGQVEEQIKYPVVFENTLRSSDRDYLTIMSVQDIVNLYKSNILEYNYDTQRTPEKRRKKDGSIIQKPRVNRKSVEKIAELMVKGKYKADTITFNLLMDGNDECSYNEKDKTLTIHSGELDILDGFHRIEAMQIAVELNPNIDLNMNVAIKNYPLDEARFYFGQINTINLPDKARTRELKQESIADMIVSDLNKKSDLAGKISTTSGTSYSKGELTNFIILSDAINDVFKPKDRKDYLDLYPFLSDFFSYLIASFKEEFVTNIAKTREKSWINHQNMFVGYVVLAKKFYDNNIPINKIVDVIKRIDFSKETSELNSIMSGQGKENSPTIRRKIREYFEKISV